MEPIESQIMNVLQKMKREKRYIALSLWPPSDNSIIKPQGNRMYINEGRDGKFEEVSEAFYDSVVERYDSRCRKR
jgi:hypothetical protein